MSSVFLLPQNVLPLLHPTVLEDRGKTLRAVIFGVEEALTLEAIIFFKVSLLPGSPATPAHPGTGRERPTYLTSSRPKACAELSSIQPASPSLSTSSWESDKGLRSLGGNEGGFCAQQWPQSSAPKGAAAGTAPSTAEWLSCLAAVSPGAVFTDILV